MKKPFILFLSLLMLFLSSCMMKNMLWDYFGIERAISTKAIVSSQEDILSDTSGNTINFCTSSLDKQLDSATVIPASANVPMVLFLGLLILSWIFTGLAPENASKHDHIPVTLAGTVPLYLKLGRLIYYS